MYRNLVSFLIFTLLLAACAAPPMSPTVAAPTPTALALPSPTPPLPTPPPTPTLPPASVRIALNPNLPPTLVESLQEALRQATVLPDGRPIEFDSTGQTTVEIRMARTGGQDAERVAQRIYVVVAPFATVQDGVSLADLDAAWSGQAAFDLLVTEDEDISVSTFFGSLPVEVVPAVDLLATLSARPGAVGLLPFDQLDPTFKVLAVDGVNPLANHLDLAAYPLVLDLVVDGADASAIAPLVAGAIAPTNRDASRLTTLVMTGVTAMSRGTAVRMEAKGYTYPALVISDTLRAADITHVSNEVPFIQGCQADNSYMNLVLCSDYPYWASLEAIGTDIVGLSGNHVNDFGRAGARESLAFYRDRSIPIYGSGLTEEEACQPLRWEDHGNSFAFFATLAWWPDTAWATASEPGACYFYDNYDRILAEVQRLSQEVDIVAVELQYHETYNPWPTKEQVEEFRTLRAAGADIVTGVQSHVPQALEPYGAMDGGDPGMIVYGLGNLFFDQMQDWETRTGLIARHTLYQGRVLSTEILTTVLEDFAQPRWATPVERAEILRRIFAAAPGPGPAREPTPTPEPAAELLPSPEPPPTPLVSATELVTVTQAAAAAGEPTLGGLWPASEPQPEEHYWLARPLPPEANWLPAATYTFGSTSGGAYRAHHGLDFANAMGTTVLAPDAGVIVHAGPDHAPDIFGPYPDFYGNMVLLRLDRSWREQPVYVLLGHLSEVLVTAGAHVERGQPVGRVGMSGIAIGPHLHVEVRLAGTTYADSVNAALWLDPLPGTGTVAGQVVSPDSRAWQQVRVLLYRLTPEERRLTRVIPTYADDPGLRPDPSLAENFALGDVPAGDYELVFKVNNRVYKQRLLIEPGRTGYVQFVVME